ncbi:MAG: hypothetical protein ABI488_25600 [Polyangiaceae bacterium]
MSTRREDDSRPQGNASSQRTTARDVPIAKYKEVPVGTSPPGALRGPSLLPGRGAPEKIIPEEVELAVAVHRDAETLDGQNVARATARRQTYLSNSPSPMPVSVEVPRARSVPAFEEIVTTPTSPSARSIQSGTLMSIGSIDPRAPTERSLPTPRPLSVSERAAYFGPEAVVDRSPSQPDTESRPVVTQRASYPELESNPVSSSRGARLPVRARLLSQPDSSAPPAQKFARAPLSYSPGAPPVSRPPEAAPRSHGEGSRSSRPGAQSKREASPKFQIHSELEAVPHEFREDAFDLRSAQTQREPLASRKPISSADWIATPDPLNLEPHARASRHSSSGMTLKVDGLRDSLPPSSEPPPPRRATIPLSWVIAAALGIIVALLVVWVLLARPVPEAARMPGEHASASSGVALLAPPNLHASAPVAPAAPLSVGTTAARPLSVHAPATNPVAKIASGLPSSSAPNTHGTDSAAAAPLPAAPDNSAKTRQAIY